MGDYMLRFWGRDQDAVAALLPLPPEKERGDGPYVTWFDSDAARREFISHIPVPAIVVRDCADGPDTHLETIAKVVFEYRGRTYNHEENFGYGYPAHSACFMFEEGNYSCDCNRSAHIRAYSDPSFEEMDCGHEIKLLSIRVFKGDRDATDDDDFR